MAGNSGERQGKVATKHGAKPLQSLAVPYVLRDCDSAIGCQWEAKWSC